MLHIDVNGIFGAVGQVDVVPVALAGGLCLILLPGHPDGKAAVVQLQAVKGLGLCQPHFFDAALQVAGKGAKVDQRQAQRDDGQHQRKLPGVGYAAHLGQADEGRHQQDGGENGGPPPCFAVVEQIEGDEGLEGVAVHRHGNPNGLCHTKTSLFRHSIILFPNNQAGTCTIGRSCGKIIVTNEQNGGGKGGKAMHRKLNLKQRIGLCFAAFFAALAAQIVLSFYQSNTVLRQLDEQMGNFNAISRFQNGVERSLSAMEDYRWEYGDGEALLTELQGSFSVMNAWLHL